VFSCFLSDPPLNKHVCTLIGCTLFFCYPSVLSTGCRDWHQQTDTRQSRAFLKSVVTLLALLVSSRANMFVAGPGAHPHWYIAWTQSFPSKKKNPVSNINFNLVHKVAIKRFPSPFCNRRQIAQTISEIPNRSSPIVCLPNLFSSRGCKRGSVHGTMTLHRSYRSLQTYCNWPEILRATRSTDNHWHLEDKWLWTRVYWLKCLSKWLSCRGVIGYGPIVA
jgi:hypothetical protein